ncbi:MAG: chorismate mutase [Petroclostridium sp.]|jgi:chorismate mutase|uniref:chorismate mutase n=1 Tax=Petroclostridium xylanilyticum TaxID=1792311 RepID=UPI000B99C983|nr:chorismate mutase [Petroclostridium xylanilyticum]MBZ4645775.1 chorismate mutase [Clostridia bacterium]MDK2810903.1 chorismate mutase [Petroclostridium sp.]
MTVRAIRGAVTVDNNTKEEIILYTKQLLKEMIMLNNIDINDMISIFFTTTKDINATFPSVAARELGLTNVPLMCASEIDVPGSLQKCIRVMVHLNTDKNLDEIIHVYLRDAKKLRPDLVNNQ